MNYSHVFPFLSGLLLFGVAGYSVRLARLFSAVRSGWLVFSSLVFLALLNLVLLASAFRGTVLWGARADITYSLTSLVLLVAMVRLEILFKRRFPKESAAQNPVSEWQSTVEKQYKKLTQAHKDLQETKKRLEAQLAERKRLQEQTLSAPDELATASGQTKEELQQRAALQQQLEEYRQTLQEVEQVHQEQLAAAQAVVEELAKTADALRTEIDTLQTDNRNLRAQIDNHRSETATHHEKHNERLQKAEALQNQCKQQEADIDRLHLELNQQEEARKELEVIREELAKRSLQPRISGMMVGISRDLGRLCTSVDSVSLAADHLVQFGISRLVQSGKLLGDRSLNNGSPAVRRGRGRKVLPDCISQLVLDFSGEHKRLVRKIENLKEKIEKVHMTVACHQSDKQPSDTDSPVNAPEREGNASLLPSPATPAVDEDRPSISASPSDDLREHLIDNVTETGTTSGDDSAELIEPEETSDAALGEHELHTAP